MKIFITGGTGYVGRAIIKKLLEEGHQLSCLVRKGSENKLGNLINHITFVEGDALDINSFNVAGHDAIIHLIAIIKEIPSKNITFHKYNYLSAKNLIDKAQQEHVNRFLLMSAVKNPPGLLKDYYKTKVEAENYLKASKLSWTILKPSLIYDKSWIGKSLGWIKYLIPFFTLGSMLPVIGNFFSTNKPISRTQIATAYANVLTNDSTIQTSLSGKTLFQLTNQ